MCYILSSAVGDERVPIGRLYHAPGQAESAARDLNVLLPSLRLDIIAVSLADLSSQPVEIREHVLRRLTRDPRHAGSVSSIE